MLNYYFITLVNGNSNTVSSNSMEVTALHVNDTDNVESLLLSYPNLRVLSIPEGMGTYRILKVMQSKQVKNPGTLFSFEWWQCRWIQKLFVSVQMFDTNSNRRLPRHSRVSNNYQNHPIKCREYFSSGKKMGSLWETRFHVWKGN